ncbi:hypothetical protein ACL90Y_00195 [Micrococcus luteus]
MEGTTLMDGFTRTGIEYVPLEGDGPLPGFALLTAVALAVAVFLVAASFLLVHRREGRGPFWAGAALIAVFGLGFGAWQVWERLVSTYETSGTVTAVDLTNGRMHLDSTGEEPLHVSGAGWDEVRVGDRLTLTCTDSSGAVVMCELP